MNANRRERLEWWAGCLLVAGCAAGYFWLLELVWERW